jgi:hypothetical protein
MLPANGFLIRTATDADAGTLDRLARLDSQRPLRRPAIIGHIHGSAAAAISLADGRIVADPFHTTERLAMYLRLRAEALKAHERTPSLRERMLQAVAPFVARVARRTA